MRFQFSYIISPQRAITYVKGLKKLILSLKKVNIRRPRTHMVKILNKLWKHLSSLHYSQSCCYLYQVCGDTEPPAALGQWPSRLQRRRALASGLGSRRNLVALLSRRLERPCAASWSHSSSCKDIGSAYPSSFSVQAVLAADCFI